MRRVVLAMLVLAIAIDIAYLFGMDLLYDLEHGIFTSGGGGVIEACLVAVTLVFSVTVLHFAWTRRAELLAGDAGSTSPAP